MSTLNKIVTRVFYYPSLGYSAALQSLGRWRKWDRLDDHVLLGGRPSRRDVRELAALGVTAIVNLCEEFGGHPREMETAGITQLYLPTLDFHCPTRDTLLNGMEFLLDQRRKSRQTYIHCKVGRGRSATLALCYLMAAHNLSLPEAFQKLKSVRPQVVRNLDRRPAVIELADTLRRRGTGSIQ